VRMTFPECSSLLCTVHSERTLKRKLASTVCKESYKLLLHAMFCLTRIKCEGLCAQAVEAAPADKKSYIRTYWESTAAEWAMYNRQHSPLLLQVTTTNPCEAWHVKLKAGAGLSKGQVAKHGLYGMAMNIGQAGHDADNRAKTAASQFRHRALATIHTKQYPEIAEFPRPVQKLLEVELSSVSDRIATGKRVPTYDNDRMECMCQFRRRYLLPCRHVFHLDTEQTVLTAEKWRGYLKLFENNGMEVYETIVQMPLEDERGPSKVRVESLLHMREMGEQLLQQLHGLYEVLRERNVPEEEMRLVVEDWMQRVRRAVQPLIDAHPDEIVNRYRRP